MTQYIEKMSNSPKGSKGSPTNSPTASPKMSTQKLGFAPYQYITRNESGLKIKNEVLLNFDEENSPVRNTETTQQSTKLNSRSNKIYLARPKKLQNTAPMSREMSK